MGTVYLADDTQIERPVAIKTLRPEDAAGLPRQELEARFLQEAKLAGRLQHPHIVTVYEVGREGDNFYIAMEYVEGEPLNRFLGPRLDVPLSKQVDMIRQVAEALDHAHRREVLHRDVKPGNILVAKDGKVKVADFGIGKLLSSNTGDLTRTGTMVGSPAYMSPEQIRGEKLDGRADFFSLGVVAYELVTGGRPFPGDSITTLVYQILHAEPRDPLSLRSDLPPAARSVFARVLAKSRDERPADAAEFIREIRRIETVIRESRTVVAPARPKTAPPPPVPPRPTTPLAGGAAAPEEAPVHGAVRPATGRTRAQGQMLFGLAALVVALGVAVGIWRFTDRRETSPAATPGPGPAAGAVPESVPAVSPAPTESLAALPTPGPQGAADAVVGAPRIVEIATPRPAPVVRPTAVRIAAAPVPSQAPPEPARPAVAEAVPPPPAPAPAAQSSADYTFRTRRAFQAHVEPDQARMRVDGREVGIADDWDDSGGGRSFPIGRQGTHRVRFTLPGYRDLDIDVIVTPEAEEDDVEVEAELSRVSSSSFPKLSSPAGATTGEVELEVTPSDATVTSRGTDLGPAARYGGATPLRLEGPMVHELLISAPGHQSRAVRVLVSPNAGKDRARIKVNLKPE
jgi:serine/threonine-protein kinase